MLTAVIVHGYHGHPKKNDWMMWLQKKLKKRGIKSSARLYPNPENPQLSLWLHVLRKEVLKASGDVILIGHSLGGATVLRFLERYNGRKIKAAVLVASAIEWHKYPKLGPFIRGPFKWKKIISVCNRFVVLHSRDDDIVPLRLGLKLAKNLHTKPIIVNGCLHFNRRREPEVRKAVELALRNI